MLISVKSRGKYYNDSIEKEGFAMKKLVAVSLAMSMVAGMLVVVDLIV